VPGSLLLYTRRFTGRFEISRDVNGWSLRLPLFAFVFFVRDVAGAKSGIYLL